MSTQNECGHFWCLAWSIIHSHVRVQGSAGSGRNDRPPSSPFPPFPPPARTLTPPTSTPSSPSIHPQLECSAQQIEPASNRGENPRGTSDWGRALTHEKNTLGPGYISAKIRHTWEAQRCIWGSNSISTHTHTLVRLFVQFSSVKFVQTTSLMALVNFNSPMQILGEECVARILPVVDKYSSWKQETKDEHTVSSRHMGSIASKRFLQE